jgi:hypothetical protein
MLWRILTGFSPRWDPTRWSKTKPNSKTFYVLFSMVQFAELGFQLWFWAKKVPQAKKECVRYGFIFAKVRLNSDGFRSFNLVITSLLLGLLLFFFIARFQFMRSKGKGTGKEKNTFGVSSDNPPDRAWL